MSRLIQEKLVAAENERLRGAGREELWSWLARGLYEAFAEARRGKLNTINEQQFEECRDVNLARLVDRVLNRTYEPLRGVAFVITEPTPREIFAASFGDRVIHHFLIQQTGDFWDKRLSPRSFSCREGKGTMYGVKMLERDMRVVSDGWRRQAWVMKIDLLGYFMSLPQEYLYSRVMWGLTRQFASGGPIYDICKYLWGKIIFDDPTDGVRIKGRPEDWKILPNSKSLFYADEGRGIVIGNLTSQWVSNMALDPLDRYVRMELGLKEYGRYVDDAYFVCESKERLLEVRAKVAEFLRGLGLTVHPKKFFLQPASHGVAFLGLVVYPGRTVLAPRFRRNLQRLKRRIADEGISQANLTSLMAYRGLAQHYNYRKTFEGMFGAEIWREMEKWQDLT